MLVQSLEQQLLLLQLPLLRLVLPLFLLFLTTLMLTISLARFDPLHLTEFDQLVIVVITRSIRSSCRGGGSRCMRGRRLALLVVVVVMAVAVLEVLLLVRVQYEPIATLAFTGVGLDFVGLLGVRHHLLEHLEYLEFHWVEVSRVVCKIVLWQNKLEGLLG